MREKKSLIILAGPTASGKSALSIELARAVGGEIISADSMQVYRGMDIGSAKISEEERGGVPHHLLDVLNPDEAFDVSLFQKMAKEAMEGIYSRGHIPILVGGTGFYIQAVLYDIDFAAEEEDTTYREQLEKEAAELGPEVLHERLAGIDPESAASIHANNLRKVIRALEVYEKTGRKMSEINKEQRAYESPYNFAYFVLTDDRALLYDRINRRVDKMVEDGLVSEVERLRSEGCHRGMVSMQGLGYKEILDYLEGQITLDEAIDIIKRDTRHFAKRQLTWFRREKEVTWLDRSICREGTQDQGEARLLEEALQFIKEKNILAEPIHLP